MAVVAGGSKCNLITGTARNEDGKQDYGRHKWLAQTFPLSALHVIWAIRVKGWTILGDEFFHCSVRSTDAEGKPTGPDIAHTTLAPGGEARYPPGKWRRFLFVSFPNLPAGTYALLISVPGAVWDVDYKLSCNLADNVYPLGKAFVSWDSGDSWEELPNLDFMFEVWGWEPPPVDKPEPAISNWAPTNFTHVRSPEDYLITVTTDIPVHLFLRWTATEPLTHPTELFRRGISLPNATRWCFVAFHEIEQKEDGDTYIHTFLMENWPFCETRWFYFVGTKQAEESPSASPIFHLHPDHYADLLITEPWTKIIVPEPTFELYFSEPWTS